MKNAYWLFITALTLTPLAHIGCQSPQTEQTGNAQTVSVDVAINVPPSLLKTAEWAGFKYMETLDKAKKSDPKALFQLFDFYGTVDGVDALNHAVVCLELIPAAKDQDYALVVASLKPNLKKVVLERMILAQGRTKNEAFKQPLAQWAPLTWDALNNKSVPDKRSENSTFTQPGQTKPGARNADEERQK